MRELDRNSWKTIESLSAPVTPIVQDAVFCQNNVFCALPTYSCRQLHTGSYWVSAPQPMIRKKAQMILMDQKEIESQLTRMVFNLSSKDR